MGKFRQFLRGTEGEVDCLFWMDVHHWLQQLYSGNRDMLSFIEWIRTHYTNDNASFRLKHETRMKLTAAFCHLNTSAASVPPDLNQHNCGITSLSSSHRGHLQTIAEAQGQVMTGLREYWYNLYAGISKTALADVTVDGRESTASPKRQSGCLGLPDIIAESEHHQCREGNTQQSFVKLSEIDRKINSTTIKRVNGAQPLDSSLVMKPLFSPSTAELFPHSDITVNHHTLQLAERDCFHLSPFLAASLRADSLAGNPLLSYLSRHCLNHKAVNYLLFWQSTEVLFIKDEMRRCHRSEKSRKQQKGGDCPYGNYSDECKPTAKNPTELVQLFIMKGAPHMIELPCHSREELVLLLPKGLGQSLLISVQEFAAQVGINAVFC